MSSRYTDPDADDATRYPDRTGDHEEPGDARHLASDPDGQEDEEAGYGYGV